MKVSGTWIMNYESMQKMRAGRSEVQLQPTVPPEVLADM
jgi:hypothetical protein